MIGRDPALRVDSTGHFYGDEMLSATEEGKWVSYVFTNPDTGEETHKHAWIVRHDGLYFGRAGTSRNNLEGRDAG